MPTIVYCGACGESIAASSRFCTSCGENQEQFGYDDSDAGHPSPPSIDAKPPAPHTTVLDEDIFCEQCGASIAVDHQYCTECGAARTAIGAPADGPPPESTARRCPHCAADSHGSAWCFTCGTAFDSAVAALPTPAAFAAAELHGHWERGDAEAAALASKKLLSLEGRSSDPQDNDQPVAEREERDARSSKPGEPPAASSKGPDLPLHNPAPYPTARSQDRMSSALRTTGRALDGAGTVVGVLARVVFVVVWGAAAVALLGAGQPLPALGCAAYALYLAFGGSWFIW
jgi:Double zinc ribbon